MGLAPPAILVRSSSSSDTTYTPVRPTRNLIRVPSAGDAKASRWNHSSTLSRPTPATFPSICQTLSDGEVPANSPGEDLFEDSPQRTPWSERSEYLSDGESETGEASSILDLSFSGFDAVPVSLFAQSDCLLQIRLLDLSGNPFDISQDKYLTETLLLPQLSSLFLRGCKMSNVEPLVTHLKAPNLKELDISSHQLSGFCPAFRRHFPRLETLLLKDGQLEYLEEVAINGLQIIDLSGNLVRDDDGRLREMCANSGTKLLL